MYLTDTPPWFCFLIHPREVSDVDQISGASLLRRYSKDDEDFIARACSSPAVVLGEVTMRGSSIRGEVIGVVRMPRTILTRAGVRAVVEAAQLSAQRGAAVVGLGGLTAPATAGGSLLLPRLPPDITVTNGNGLTAAIAKDNVMEALAFRGGPSPTVAVLGATGSVGVASSYLLADEGLDLILVGRPAELRKRLGGLSHVAALTDDVATVGDADAVLVLTNDPSARLRPAMLKPGTVVVDVAQPANVPAHEYPEFRRADIAIAPGGIVQVPGFRCTQDFFLEDVEDTFACLAETYLMASTGLREHSVGRPSPDFARMMSSLAAQHRIRPRALQLEPPDNPTPAAWPNQEALACMN